MYPIHRCFSLGKSLPGLGRTAEMLSKEPDETPKKDPNRNYRYRKSLLMTHLHVAFLRPTFS